MVKGKTSTGKKKIEMKRIEDEKARSVCFSKRRQGMFKKASELSILCGAMVAIVSFSPSGRPFSFGSPSFEAVVNRFLALIGPATSGASCDSISEETSTVRESLECSELEQLVEDERKTKERLKEVVESGMDGRLMDLLTAEVFSSGIDELQELCKKLAAIQDVVKEKIKEMSQEERHQTMPYPPAFVNLALKYLFDRETATATPISSVAPSSNHGAVDALGVNGSLASSVHAISTSVNCPRDKLDG